MDEGRYQLYIAAKVIIRQGSTTVHASSRSRLANRPLVIRQDGEAVTQWKYGHYIHVHGVGRHLP